MVIIMISINQSKVFFRKALIVLSLLICLELSSCGEKRKVYKVGIISEVTLAIAFLALSAIVLFIASSLELYFNFVVPR